MSIQLEQVIEDLSTGRLSLDEACRVVAEASQADPVRTRFWNQRIETELGRGKLSRSAARALFDALESFQTDKTMWLDSAAIQKPGSPFPVANPARAPSKDVDLEALKQALLNTDRRRAAGEWAARASAPLNAAVYGPTEWPEVTPAPRAANSESDPNAVVVGSLLLGRYKVAATLGLGGIGQVYDAVDTYRATSEVHVTVKVPAINLRHQPAAYEELRKAVQRTQHLQHPNIVRVHDIDRDGDRILIVMEALRGRWLSGLVREVRGHGLPYDSAWPIISGIANGLAYAHQQGVVHSDLSPHSIFLCDDGTPKIMGFGLVHAVPSSNESLDVLDTLTLRAYTEAYTADAWSAQSKPHPADDLYPLGVIAYEMLTGTHPFQRYSLAVARQKGLSFAPIPGLNRRARKLIQKCLSFERKVRPQDAAGFLDRMEPGFWQRMLAARL